MMRKSVKHRHFKGNFIRKKRDKKFNRYSALIIIMIFIFFIIISKLIILQVIKADNYREMTSKKSIRNIPITPPRGNIIDCNGNILAESKQGYSLVFTQTDESRIKFFTTMEKVFKLLHENDEIQKDDFELKIKPYRFEFSSDNPKIRKWMELRFKKDRGMDDLVLKELFGKKKKKEELSEDEKKKLDDALLKKTPEETFNYLLDIYEINKEENKLVYTELFNKIFHGTNGEEKFKNYLDEYDVKYDEDINKTFKALFKKIPKEEFQSLINKYNINQNKYSLELKRKFMLVKDSIKLQSFSGFKPIVISSNINKNSAFVFMQEYEQLPGIEVTMDPIRVYPYKELGSAFIGYLSKVNSYQQEKYEEKGYDVTTDYIGASGIENAFESTLRGSKGTKIVQINKKGRIMRELGRKDPYPGKTVKLTIDKDLQNVTEKAMDEAMKRVQAEGRSGDVDMTNATRGATVVVDVKTGKILALASRPGYDPNFFAVPGRLTPELQERYFSPNLEEFGKQYVGKLLRRSYSAREGYSGLSQQQIIDKLFPLDKSIKNNSTIRQDYFDIYPKPLYNYATKSLVPPGSTFKPLTAVAGLEEGAIHPDESIYCPSMFTKHGYKGRNFKNIGYGSVDVTMALEKSINYFFFETGDRLYQQKKYNNGFDAIAHYAWKFGLGAPKGVKPATGLEINERFGQVYNLESGRRIFSSLYMDSLINLLLQGTDTRTPGYKSHYISIDIRNKENDLEEINNLKSRLRSRILEEMKYKGKGTEDIKSMVFDFVTKDVNISKKYKDAYDKSNKKVSYEKFIQDQVEQTWLAIVYSIDDANFNVNNQNNVYDASIGQGTNQFTPVQLANYIATLANGGTRYNVHLVDKILDQDGKIVKEFKPEVIEKIELKKSTIETVKKGMRDVTSEGTARTYLGDFPIPNGGKTGSATFSKLQDQYGRTSYAVYVGFAPFENPEIAICTIVFDGGHGGSIASVARAVYEEYFKDTLAKNYPGYVPKYNYKLDEIKKDEDKDKEKNMTQQEVDLLKKETEVVNH